MRKILIMNNEQYDTYQAVLTDKGKFIYCKMINEAKNILDKIQPGWRESFFTYYYLGHIKKTIVCTYEPDKGIKP